MDAIVAYRSFKDIECLIKLCLCLEHCEKTIRFIKGRPDYSHFSVRLLEKPEIVDLAYVGILQKLFKDRGCVAHGSRPSNLLQKPELLTEYVAAVHACFLNYINAGSSVGWDSLIGPGRHPFGMPPKLGSKRRKVTSAKGARKQLR
jgi:hypothetical protein